MVDRGEVIFPERGTTKLDSNEETPSPYLPEVPRITIEEVKAKLDADSNIVVIDSRSKDDYERSRIVGAISIPLDDMAEPYSHLDHYDEIITYCTWLDEEISARAAQKLIKAGYNAKAIEVGFEAWEDAGFPVEESDSES